MFGKKTVKHFSIDESCQIYREDVYPLFQFFGFHSDNLFVLLKNIEVFVEKLILKNILKKQKCKFT